MEISKLIAALSQPSVYPHAPDAVEVRQTHISAVFLAGGFVYKIKKPVELGFLDFGTLEKRRHDCQEEVRLNRRLAAGVYLGVVPVAETASGLKVEGAGEVVEWAVKMIRLADDASLESHLARGAVDDRTIAALGRRIAEFHARADAGPHVAEFGRFEVVARNARENLEQIVPQIGTALSRACFERLSAVVEEALARNRALIESRAERGVPRDTHGDLRPGHVYLFPEREPPDDLIVIDCVEFSERFRFADPVADMAFLAMGLAFSGHRDLARSFSDAYFRASGDQEGQQLLSFYSSYRAAVRGKVESMKAAEPEIPRSEREAALTKARGYWLMALGELESPAGRPCLVVVAGLPGSGKSALAAELAARACFTIIRSDVVRKQLAGLAADESSAAQFGEGIYSPVHNELTYAECLRRADALLFDGRRVVIDASFREDAPRRAFLEAAFRWGVPGVILICQARGETIRGRLTARRGDASDADWSIYRQAAEKWQPPGPLAGKAWRVIDTDGQLEQAVDRALRVLRETGLF